MAGISAKILNNHKTQTLLNISKCLFSICKLEDIVHFYIAAFPTHEIQ